MLVYVNTYTYVYIWTRILESDLKKIRGKALTDMNPP